MTELRLSDGFTEKATELFNGLNEAIINNGTWQEELNYAIKKFDETLMPTDKTTMVEYASPTLADGISEINNSLPGQLAHAFADPVKKAMNLISYIGDEDDIIKDKEILEALLTLKEVLEDNIHNYPFLLGEDTPDEVQKIINQYKDITIPQINIMVKELSDDTGIDISTIKVDTLNGNEHLGRLPDGIFTDNTLG